MYPDRSFVAGVTFALSIAFSSNPAPAQTEVIHDVTGHKVFLYRTDSETSGNFLGWIVLYDGPTVVGYIYLKDKPFQGGGLGSSNYIVMHQDQRQLPALVNLLRNEQGVQIRYHQTPDGEVSTFLSTGASVSIADINAALNAANEATTKSQMSLLMAQKGKGVDATVYSGDGKMKTRLLKQSGKKAEKGSSKSLPIDMESRNYRFSIDDEDNPTIRVKKGTKVILNLASEGGRHDWVLADDDGEEDVILAQTSRVSTGQPAVVIEFTADVVGEHVYYCSVGSHRAHGMHGAFIVEDCE